MTTQKKVIPTRNVRTIAVKYPRDLKSELASSTYLPTDSNPPSSHGTTCQTNKIEISGLWLNRGLKFSVDPCFAPARANTTTSVRNVKVVVLASLALD